LRAFCQLPADLFAHFERISSDRAGAKLHSMAMYGLTLVIVNGDVVSIGHSCLRGIGECRRSHVPVVFHVSKLTSDIVLNGWAFGRVYG